MDSIIRFFNDNPYLVVFIVAMIPTLESKISIPLGISKEIWGNSALNIFISTGLSFIGAVIPFFVLFFLIRRIKNRMSGFIYNAFLVKIKEGYGKKFNKLAYYKNDFIKCLRLIFFVAIPLPLTGVYTGTVIAALSNLGFFKSLLSILVGEFISCLIVVLICKVFSNSILYILLISLILVFAYIVIEFIYYFIIKKFSNKKEKR